MGEQDVLKMQQRKDFLVKFCYWAVIAVCIYAGFKYLLPVLFPFVLAYGIAYILAKPVRRIAGESRWKRAFFSILLSAVFFITVGGLAVWLGVWLFSGVFLFPASSRFMAATNPGCHCIFVSFICVTFV